MSLSLRGSCFRPTGNRARRADRPGRPPRGRETVTADVRPPRRPRDGKPGERRDNKRDGDSRQGIDDAHREGKRDTRRPDERRPAGAKPDGKPRKEQPPLQEVRGNDETGEKRKPRARPDKDKSIVAESGERVTMPEDIGPSPSIAAVGALVTADSVVEATRTEGQEIEVADGADGAAAGAAAKRC